MQSNQIVLDPISCFGCRERKWCQPHLFLLLRQQKETEAPSFVPRFFPWRQLRGESNLETRNSFNQINQWNKKRNEEKRNPGSKEGTRERERIVTTHITVPMTVKRNDNEKDGRKAKAEDNLSSWLSVSDQLTLKDNFSLCVTVFPLGSQSEEKSCRGRGCKDSCPDASLSVSRIVHAAFMTSLLTEWVFELFFFFVSYFSYRLELERRSRSWETWGSMGRRDAAAVSLETNVRICSTFGTRDEPRRTREDKSTRNWTKETLKVQVWCCLRQTPETRLRRTKTKLEMPQSLPSNAWTVQVLVYSLLLTLHFSSHHRFSLFNRIPLISFIHVHLSRPLSCSHFSSLSSSVYSLCISHHKRLSIFHVSEMVAS